MIVRQSTYLTALHQLTEARTKAARFEARSDELAARCRELERQVKQERSEVRRLTDMVATMRQEGLMAGPGHGAPEATWGSYSLDEADQEAMRKKASDGVIAPESEEELGAALEAELRAEGLD